MSILIVDDYAEIRDTLRYILEAEGYSVDTAVDGVDALEKLREIRPRLIIMDLMMPRMDGYRFVQELRRLGPFEKVPVIAMTAHDARCEDFSDLDVQASLAKPFELDELLQAVGRLLPAL